MTDPLAGLAPAPELPPVVETPEPQNMSDQQNHAFADLRAKMHQSRRMAEEFRDQFNGLVEQTKGFLDEKAAFADQLNKKDEENRQLQEDLGKLELSRSPAFKEKYDTPLEKVCTDIASALQQNGVPQDESFDRAAAIMAADQNQLGELIGNLPTMAQGEVLVHTREAQRLFGERDAELNEWRTSQIGAEAVATRQDAIAVAQRTAALADQAIGILRGLSPDGGLPPAYAVTDADLAKQRDDREAGFKDWLARAPEDVRMSAMLEGYMAPKTYEMLRQTMIENVQLKRLLMSRGSLARPPAAPTHVAPVAPPAPPRPPEGPKAYSPVGDTTNAASFTEDFVRKSFAQMGMQ